MKISTRDNGLSRLDVFFNALLLNTIDERLSINGITAPKEHELLGLANAGFNRSRFFKI